MNRDTVIVMVAMLCYLFAVPLIMYTVGIGKETVYKTNTSTTINRTINESVDVTVSSKIVNRTIHKTDDVVINKPYNGVPTKGYNGIGVYTSGDYTLNNVKPICLYGSSMVPAIPPGSTVLMKEYNKRIHDVERGMIVMFEGDDGSKTVHRVHAQYPQYILLRGDNVQYADDRIDESQITHYAVGISLTDRDCEEEFG